MDSHREFPARTGQPRGEEPVSGASEPPKQPLIKPTPPPANGNPGLSTPIISSTAPLATASATQTVAPTPFFTFAYTLLFFVLGALMVVLPWTAFWTNNSLLDSYPAMQGFLSNNFVRGLFSGIGVLDIWAAFSEGVHLLRAVRSAN